MLRVRGECPGSGSTSRVLWLPADPVMSRGRWLGLGVGDLGFWVQGFCCLILFLVARGVRAVGLREQCRECGRAGACP